MEKIKGILKLMTVLAVVGLITSIVCLFILQVLKVRFDIYCGGVNCIVTFFMGASVAKICAYSVNYFHSKYIK